MVPQPGRRRSPGPVAPAQPAGTVTVNVTVLLCGVRSVGGVAVPAFMSPWTRAVYVPARVSAGSVNSSPNERTSPEASQSVPGTGQSTVHGSGGNGTGGWRRGYVVAFRSAATVAEERARGFTHSHNDPLDVLTQVGRETR